MERSLAPIHVTPVMEVHIPPVLTQDDYERMKRVTRCWRDTLLLMFLRNTGLRPSEVCAITLAQFIARPPVYYVLIQRAKKRGRAHWEPVYLSPNLGHPLSEYARGQNLRPTDRLFGLEARQVRNITYQAGMSAIGRRVQPREFRRLYVRTVAEIAPRVVGFLPQHMQIAQQMVGHNSVRTTWDWYFRLTEDERRAIQEMVPV